MTKMQITSTSEHITDGMAVPVFKQGLQPQVIKADFNRKEPLELIQFLGSRNKSDFILYFAHVLNILNKRVLIVDFTKEQVYSGYTRLANEQKLYDFHDIDILGDVTDWLDIEEKLKKEGETTISYDVMLIDVDSVQTLQSEWPEFNERFYVGDYDRVNQLKDVHLIKAALENSENNEMKRVTFQSKISIDEDSFSRMLDSHVQWLAMNYLFEPDELSESLRLQMQHEQSLPYNRMNKQHKQLITEIISAMYTMHVKDIELALKPALFNFTFKRNKQKGLGLERSGI